MKALPGGTEMIARAMPGTKTTAKLSQAEGAGIKAIHAEIRRIQHERRELGIQDQKLAVQEEETVDILVSAWKECAESHGLDPNVPLEGWQISKKNKATLDPKHHPLPAPKLPGEGEGKLKNGRAPSGDQPRAPGAPGASSTDGGPDRPPDAVGGDANGGAQDDSGGDQDAG